MWMTLVAIYQDVVGLTAHMKFNDNDVHKVQQLISCLRAESTVGQPPHPSDLGQALPESERPQ